MNSKGFHASKFIRQLPPLQLKDPLIFNYRFPSICALLLSPQREPLIFPPICLTKHFPLRQMTQIPIWINSLRRNSFPISLVCSFFLLKLSSLKFFNSLLHKENVSLSYFSLKIIFSKGEHTTKSHVAPSLSRNSLGVVHYRDTQNGLPKLEN